MATENKNISFYISNPNPHSIITTTENRISDDFIDVKVKLVFEKPTSPLPILLRSYFPSIDIYSVWSTVIFSGTSLNPNWAKRSTSSRLASGAPLHCLISQYGKNRLTIALSDVMTPISISTGVREEDGTQECDINLFVKPINPITEYSVTIRIDISDRMYFETIKSIQKWWSTTCGYSGAYIPEEAKLPVYSTWYSFHQQLSTEDLLKQCNLAVEMGMKTIIVDDGWQTDDNSRGYATCGDWIPSSNKIHNIKEFTDNVHKIGMKVVFWYSVPFIGQKSSSFKQFSTKLLGMNNKDTEGSDWGTLDPRYPEVRKYLVEKYKRAMIEWGIDGFKLDFIDSFQLMKQSTIVDEKHDTYSVEEGVKKLLEEIYTELYAINPNVLIEFRQTYIGPLMQQYGNMFRVGDCPNDIMKNRTASIQLRYLLGESPVHSDMIMWNLNDTNESVARQLISCIFTVPQISVRLDLISKAHYQVLKNFLEFWNSHRDILLGGELIAYHPEAQYSLVEAQNNDNVISVCYFKQPLCIKSNIKKKIAFNCSSHNGMLIDFSNIENMANYKIYNCLGENTGTGTAMSSDHYLFLNVPDGGRIEITV